MGDAWFARTNGDVVQVKYTNQMRLSCMGPAQNVPSAWKGRETYMLLIGSDRRAQQKGAARKAEQVFLLPDQIKRDKGVWWMPWQQEAMKDVIPCDKPWGAGNRI